MSEHLDLETIAELVEGSLTPASAELAHEHLAFCRSCTAAFADAVRYRAAWLAEAAQFEPAAIESKPPVALPSMPGSVERSRRPLLASVAALLVVTAAATWLVRGAGEPAPLRLPPAVLTATEASSAGGFVIPGGEAAADASMPAYRSGGADIDPDLQQQSDAVVGAYERGDRSAASAARVVVSLLAVQERDAARDYAREGLRRWPEDARLRVLSAALRYAEDDLAGAESDLRRAVRRAPGDAVAAFDLAMVLRERGSASEASQWFARVEREGPAALRSRARTESQRLAR